MTLAEPDEGKLTTIDILVHPEIPNNPKFLLEENA